MVSFLWGKNGGEESEVHAWFHRSMVSVGSLCYLRDHFLLFTQTRRKTNGQKCTSPSDF